ncbi:hypothetical protein HYU07_04320 [Candidatus Woesearchaeota archaeon]|nr:hypothetical protein [Candidatus Woesearchaeota archaeon]
MKEKSIFLEKEGYTPKNKVLDFLIVAQDFDYSLKEIAKYADISYPCMKQLKKELVKGRWIVLTRKVGKAQMYKLNLRSKKVQKFIEFFWSVVSEEVENNLGIKEEKSEVSHHSHSASSLGSVAVSAKSV